MKANPTTKKFFQLVDIPDYRFAADKKKCSHIDFDQSQQIAIQKPFLC
ncbi:hypothetical protein MMF17_002728 [Enterobacter hormaechei]|nr:hypothetical protein [Enterobacter hormaechei]